MSKLLIASATGEQLRIPFTTEQFIQILEKYNQTVFPMQFVPILVALISVSLAANILWRNLTPKIEKLYEQ